MTYNPHAHHRRSIRLPACDYRQAGAYFVTICTHERACIFDDAGLAAMVEKVWRWTTKPTCGLADGEFVVMPNHVHGIIWITAASAVGAQRRATSRLPATPFRGNRHPEHADDLYAAPLRPAQPPVPRVLPGSLAAIVRSFKSITTKRVNRIRATPGAPFWQRNYYERVVRDEDELNRIRQYVRDNPAKWADDPNNPANIRAVMWRRSSKRHRSS